MSAGLYESVWAIKPCLVGGRAFPGLPACQDPNNDGAWQDLTEEIGHLIARLKIIEKRQLMTGSVKTVAQIGLWSAIDRLLGLAAQLEKA